MTSPYQRVYDLLLRLYPRAYRADFADEMRDVFAQAVEDVTMPRQRTLFLLREMLHIPPNAARQHWQALRQSPAYLYQGDTLMMRSDHRIYRISSLTLLFSIGLFAVLVMMPFFIYGLHRLPAEEVTSGWFDPKGFWPYQNGTGLMSLAMITMLLMPLFGAITAALLGFTFVRRRLWPFSRQQATRLIVLIFALAALVFPFTSLGWTITVWFLD